MWRYIAQSQQGSSHVADDIRCQDSNRVCIVGENAASTLIACIADGAGSAQHSDVGSRIACETVIEKARACFDEHGGFDEMQRDDALIWCEEIQQRIHDAALDRNCSERDLATTLSVAIVAPSLSIFFQIGDGGIIVRSHGVYGIVFWPQSGEYANSTNFVTVDDFRDRLDFLSLKFDCADVALLTDGLQRLALALDHRTPHVRFFEPLFNVLRASNDVVTLNEGLLGFLSSEAVQTRSDDDTTLILASRDEA